MNIQELVNNSWVHAAERHAHQLGVSNQLVLRMWETLLFWLLVQWFDPPGARQLSRVERCVSLGAQQWILLLPWRSQEDDKDEEGKFERL